MRKKQILLDEGMLGPSTAGAASPPEASAPHASRAPQRTAKDYGEPLNFRVPPEFSQEVSSRCRASASNFMSS